jgi:hypothetical protein
MKSITAADATRMPGTLPKIRARRLGINPPPAKVRRVIKGRGWVA